MFLESGEENGNGAFWGGAFLGRLFGGAFLLGAGAFWRKFSSVRMGGTGLGGADDDRRRRRDGGMTATTLPPSNLPIPILGDDDDDILFSFSLSFSPPIHPQIHASPCASFGYTTHSLLRSHSMFLPTTSSSSSTTPSCTAPPLPYSMPYPPDRSPLLAFFPLSLFPLRLLAIQSIGAIGCREWDRRDAEREQRAMSRASYRLIASSPHRPISVAVLLSPRLSLGSVIRYQIWIWHGSVGGGFFADLLVPHFFLPFTLGPHPTSPLPFLPHSSEEDEATRAS
ncbi:hypothetical protein C8R47DRAFT_1152129 [Mycena vitilis]|nr:hypothetical protein C8R47DRAFT_1152129 [Mycena vitilis]